MGLLGAISFISFSIGSFFFTKQSDVYGRHRVVSIAAAFTPIGLIVLITLSKHIGLLGIYIVFSIMGLCYNPRGSTAYLYGCEILPKPLRLYFSTVNFSLDGTITMTAPLFFYYIGDIRVFFMIMGTIFTTALLSFIFILPESPSFLLSKANIDGYQKAMVQLTGQKREDISGLDAQEFEEFQRSLTAKP